MTKTSRTMHDKIWDDHVIYQQPNGTCLIYVDRHLVHEVSSPQAFEGLRVAGRRVHAPQKTFNGRVLHFDIDPFHKHRLLNGLDDIALTEQRQSEIDRFEERATAARPWA